MRRFDIPARTRQPDPERRFIVGPRKPVLQRLWVTFCFGVAAQGGACLLLLQQRELAKESADNLGTFTQPSNASVEGQDY